MFLCSCLSLAQKYAIAPEGGIVLSQFNNNNIYNYQNKTSYYLGSNAEVSLKKSLSLRTGIFYSINSFAAQGDVDSAEGLGYIYRIDTHNVTLHYIKIPLNIAYQIPLFNGAVSINGGIYLRYGVNGKKTTDTRVVGSSFYFNGSVTDPILWGNNDGATAHFNMGINAGVDYIFPFNLYISFRYSYSLTPINIIDLGNLNLGYFNIGLGYKYVLKQRTLD